MSSPLVPGVNDLATTMPEIAAEWNYVRNGELRPCDVMAGTDKQVWWKCSCGHEWFAYIYSRKIGSGCPYCAGNAVLPGYNDIATVAPELLQEWDYEKNCGITPEQVAPQTNRKVWWRCSLGHSWEAPVSSRTAGKDCPVCAGRQVFAGFNDLASRSPALAAEWDYDRNGTLTPDSVAEYSHKKVWWRDSLGHSWRATLANRSNGNGCPFCAGRQVLSGFNDLASQYPQLVRQWNHVRNGTLTPDTVTAKSNRVVWWICQNGHEWKTSIYNRSKGDDCPICGNRTVLAGYNDLTTIHPELAAEWDYEKNCPLLPSDLVYASRRKVWWKCTLGHSWKEEVYARHKGFGCPFCSGKRAFPGFNDLLTLSPQIAESWDYDRNGDLTPDMVLPFTNRRAWWKCEKDHHWRSTVNSRQRAPGCPYCTGIIPARGHLVP